MMTHEQKTRLGIFLSLATVIFVDRGRVLHPAQAERPRRRLPHQVPGHVRQRPGRRRRGQVPRASRSAGSSGSR
ncbi:MAG: hypothetical protein M0C28_15085 [Candidatus Moduliflexus flocculans]|nr:hypothetical protein [Candidatus Moduliflexus flocculans]